MHRHYGIHLKKVKPFNFQLWSLNTSDCVIFVNRINNATFIDNLFDSQVQNDLLCQVIVKTKHVNKVRYRDQQEIFVLFLLRTCSPRILLCGSHGFTISTYLDMLSQFLDGANRRDKTHSKNYSN